MREWLNLKLLYIGVCVMEDFYFVKKKKNVLIMIWVDFNYLYIVLWYKIYMDDVYCYEISNII